MAQDESASGPVDARSAQAEPADVGRPMPEPSQSDFGQEGIMGAPVSEPTLKSWGHFVSEFSLDASPSWLFPGSSQLRMGPGDQSPPSIRRRGDRRPSPACAF